MLLPLNDVFEVNLDIAVQLHLFFLLKGSVEMLKMSSALPNPYHQSEKECVKAGTEIDNLRLRSCDGDEVLN